MSTIDQIILDYRNAVSAKDMAVLADLTRAWLKVEQGLESEISALAGEITRRLASGEIVTEQMLWKMQSYRRTLAEMERLIVSYNQVAIDIIAKAQYEAYLLGVTKANEIVIAELVSAGLTPPYWEKLNKDAIEAALGVMNDKNPFYASLYKDYGDSANAFRQALVEGIARGQGVSQLALGMRDATGMGLNRSMLIAQTEMSRAYRSGTIEQYRGSGVGSYYVRLVKKDTACLACLLKDGERYELAEDMSDHPRGRCDLILKIQGVPLPSWEHGSTWFRNQSAEYQQSLMGPTRYEMWKDGTPLDSFIHLKDDPIWGKQPAIIPIRDL
ncbi:MAG: hypothetical protein A2Y53_06960 [Chloroflexi bacterium RBG_16_47_49]|nr:MAG: hypothetical protein A2Y53_06960 [Chloroflexi bacterium RBG_16_47_49]